MKILKLTLIIALTYVFMVSTAFAGTWQTVTSPNQSKWWYDNEDGSYPSNGWQWIDDDNDGIAECYYFNTEGWLLTNTTTPDNYQVNENGAWIKDSIVQTQTTTSDYNNTNSQNISDYNGTYEYYKTQIFFRDNPDQEYQFFAETPVWDKLSYDSAMIPRIEQLNLSDCMLEFLIANSSEEDLFLYYHFLDYCSDENFIHYTKTDKGYRLNWYRNAGQDHFLEQDWFPKNPDYINFENNTLVNTFFYSSDDIVFSDTDKTIHSLNGKDIMIKTLYTKR